MTLLSSLLMPCEFDPSLWDNPDIGRLLHHASQQLYDRDFEGALATLTSLPDGSTTSERWLSRGLLLRTYHTDPVDMVRAHEVYESEKEHVDLDTVAGAYVGYYGALTYITTGQTQEALDILAIIEHTSREHEEHLFLGLILSLIGGCLADLGDVNTATKYFLEAREILSEHGNSRLIVRATFNLAFAYQLIGRHQDALPIALQFYSNHHAELDPPELSTLYGLLQRLFEAVENFDEALTWIDKHDVLAREHGVESVLRINTIDRSLLLMRKQQYDDAYTLAIQTEDFPITDLQHEYIARRSLTLGVCLQHYSRKSEARDAFARIASLKMGHNISYYTLSSILKEITERTKNDPELYDPSVSDAYRHLLETRVSENETNASFIIDIHARYASRLAQYRREREEQFHTTLLEAGEEARRDIATAIHDGAGQELAVLGMQLDMALHDLPTEHPSRQYVAQARERVSLTARQLRTLSHALGTHSLERDGLPSALYNMAGDVRSTSRITVVCDVDEHLATIPVDLARSIYRTVQTLTSNVLQHAYASTLTINVQATLDAITVRVSDDGIGTDMSRSTEGMGWRSIHARVALRGGTFSVTSAPGAGTTAIATFGYSAS